MAQFSSSELSTYGLSTVKRLLFSSLAILTFIFCALTDWPNVGYAIGLVTLFGLTWFYLTNNRDRFVGAQALVLGAFIIGYTERVDSTSVQLIGVGVIAAGLLLNQEIFTRTRPIQVANLPGRWHNSGPVLDPRLAATTHTGLVAFVGIGAAFDLPIWIVSVVAVGVTALSVAHVAQEALGRRRQRNAARAIHKALAKHQPEFVLYFSAPSETEYQVTMWLPYLERVGRPFMIILRESQPFTNISAVTSAPVIVAQSVPDVDNLIVPSLRAVFYVNNGMKNAHMVRFNQLTHVQLLHGDSDKTSSYNPVTAMFDRVYVAGQAAIDRYAANGVHIDADKFEIVGRPQIEPIEVARAGVAPRAQRTVMYGTTWAGLYADANYCSLEIGTMIVEELLRRDVTVIFRPHPYVDRNPETRVLAERVEVLLAADRARSGRNHLFGKAAQTMSLFDAFNQSDAMISDVSGIASDYLYAEKPLAMTDMADDGPTFVTKFPVSKAAHVLRRDGSNLVAVIDELLETDSLATIRRDVKVQYLGDFPADSYADAFVDAARRELVSAPESVSLTV